MISTQSRDRCESSSLKKLLYTKNYYLMYGSVSERRQISISKKRFYTDVASLPENWNDKLGLWKVLDKMVETQNNFVPNSWGFVLSLHSSLYCDSQLFYDVKANERILQIFNHCQGFVQLKFAKKLAKAVEAYSDQKKLISENKSLPHTLENTINAIISANFITWALQNGDYYYIAFCIFILTDLVVSTDLFYKIDIFKYIATCATYIETNSDERSLFHFLKMVSVALENLIDKFTEIISPSKDVLGCISFLGSALSSMTSRLESSKVLTRAKYIKPLKCKYGALLEKFEQYFHKSQSKNKHLSH